LTINYKLPSLHPEPHTNALSCNPKKVLLKKRSYVIITGLMSKVKVNVQVTKNGSEAALNLIRRFQKRVQESGVLSRVRSIRYNERDLSALKTKRAKLRKLENIAKYEDARRMGKVIERKKRR
jgi:ribosomal protein S21